MAAQTWTTLQTSLMVMLEQGSAPYNVIPSDFATLLPQATSYAEQRIYREMVPLNERGENTAFTTTAGLRYVSLTGAAQAVLSVESFALIYPAGTTTASAGTRILFDAASLDVIDIVWPQSSVTMDPSQADWIGRYWAMLDDHTIVFSPTVGAAYTILLTGNFAPVPISVTNPTTYLSTIYPELLQAACMVWLAGALQRNFGASADDAKMALSWESTYKELLASAVAEEQRRRMAGVGWSQNMPNPLAHPDRS